MLEPSPATKELNQICTWSANLLSRRPSDQEVQHFIHQVDNFDHLVEIAEEHGLRPALWHIVKPFSDQLPGNTVKLLKVLHLRQQLLCRAQHTALLEIHDAFSESGINILLLKGSALRYIIYQNEYSRMMFDLDILIPEDKTTDAQHILKKLGYHMPVLPSIKKHHHLPAAQKTIDNFQIVIELHTQALSYDMHTPISFTRFNSPFRQIEFENRKWLVLSHLDMLQHLCLHTFTRDRIIKLSGVVDIVRYAQKYYDEINWQLIKKDYSYIINTIVLLDCIITRTDKLTQIAPVLTSEQKSQISGIGFGMTPLRDALRKDKPLRLKLEDIFLPSQWWTRVFYNVPVTRSLLFTRLFRHPYTAIKWILSKNLSD